MALAATDIRLLNIDAGAGSLDVVGIPGATHIRVQAQIRIKDADADKARKLIDSDLRLSLDKHADGAMLNAFSDHGLWNSRWNSSVDLRVQVPQGTALMIDDGSGPIKIDAAGSALTIDDGSGSINVTDVSEDLTIIDDGSGSVRLSDVRGQITQPD